MPSILWFPLNLVAAIFELIFCIPIFGRGAKWLWNIFHTATHLILGIAEYGLMNLGIQPTKKMRVNVVLFKDPNDNLLVEKVKVFEGLQHAIDLFQSAAKVRLLPATGVKNKNSADGDNSNVIDDWIYVPDNPPDSRVLDVDCDFKAFAQDLWLPGSVFQFMTMSWSFPFNFQRLIGYGAPVTVFIVRDIKKFGGCSIGPLSDYITVCCNDVSCIAHELGHACNLIFHSEDPNNLMHRKGCGKTHLTRWQVAMLRTSRHVTLF